MSAEQVEFAGYKPVDQQNRSSHFVFIWGPSGVGKTTLASTAPGNKLYIMFDPNGLNSVTIDEGDIVLDFSTETGSVITKLTGNDPLGLNKALPNLPNIKTIVLDSITTMSDMALMKSVNESKGATIQLPGIPGYAWRNRIMIDVVKKLLEVCTKNDLNLMVMAHEGSPEKDEMTGRLFITFIAGGEIPNLVPLRFDEVWYLEDTGKERRITIRSNINRKPMKTRMFDSSKADSFVWKYDPITCSGHTIKEWIEQRNSTKKKLPLPA